jgi:hypothetical protein
VKLDLIAKQSKGRSFRGLLNYLLSKEGAEIVGGNMIGENAKELAAEFSASRKLRPSLSRAVYHSSLSLPPGESLSDQKWRDISQQYVSKMGFKSSQYVAVRHTDSEHSHIHIVASRISMDGRVVSDSHDFKRSESIVRGIERDYGLTLVAPSREAQAKAPKTGELHKALRENDPSTRMVLKHAIDQARINRPTMSDFIHRLDGVGVSVIPNMAKTGTITGLSFEIGGEKMKGSDIGRAYTWQGLQKKGVSYDKKRDFGSISESKIRSGIRERRNELNRGALQGGPYITGRRDKEDKAVNRFDRGAIDKCDESFDLYTESGDSRFRRIFQSLQSDGRRSSRSQRNISDTCGHNRKGDEGLGRLTKTPYGNDDLLGQRVDSGRNSVCSNDSQDDELEQGKKRGSKTPEQKSKNKSKSIDINFFDF